jgi:hypothetical protein
MVTAVQVRASAEVRNLRQRSPFINFFHDSSSFWLNTHAHPTPRDPLFSSTAVASQSTFVHENVRGSKHRLDTADFSLWDDETQDYKTLTSEQAGWIFKTYQASSIGYSTPFLTIATDHPSLPDHNGQVTLTLGCAPVIFISKDADAAGFHSGPPPPNALHYCNPSMGDPLLGQFKAERWTEPTREEARKIFEYLKTICNIKALNFILPKLIVELAGDDRVYTRRSLPVRLGGWPTIYHHHNQQDSYWNKGLPMARVRELSPSSNIKGDTTNYLTTGNRILGPGVRVEGKSMGSTAGIKLRNGNQVRMTVAHHAFKDCKMVFHPDGDSGDCIAQILERYPDQDVALAEIHPSVNFDNSQIFESPPPTRLIRGKDVQENEWYFCDGMTTGTVAMLYAGLRLAPWLTGGGLQTEFHDFRPESVLYATAPTGGAPEIRDGICGAPIIHEEDTSVAGFFQYIAPSGYCFCPRLDALIDDGWGVV